MLRLRLVPPSPETDAPAKLDCVEAFARELDYVSRTLTRFGTHSSDIEDLAHETFLVLQRRWGEYDQSRALRPYLFGIAFRVASAYRRQRSRERLTHSVDVPDLAKNPEQALESEQVRTIVLAALERVPLDRRAVFIMHELDEVPMQDVAVTLRIPTFTAYSRFRKARKEFAVAVARMLGRTAKP